MSKRVFQSGWMIVQGGRWRGRAVVESGRMPVFWTRKQAVERRDEFGAGEVVKVLIEVRLMRAER